jgi:hypothetical protein
VQVRLEAVHMLARCHNSCDHDAVLLSVVHCAWLPAFSYLLVQRWRWQATKYCGCAGTARLTRQRARPRGSKCNVRKYTTHRIDPTAAYVLRVEGCLRHQREYVLRANFHLATTGAVPSGRQLCGVSDTDTSQRSD